MFLAISFLVFHCLKIGCMLYNEFKLLVNWVKKNYLVLPFKKYIKKYLVKYIARHSAKRLFRPSNPESWKSISDSVLLTHLLAPWRIRWGCGHGSWVQNPPAVCIYYFNQILVVKILSLGQNKQHTWYMMSFTRCGFHHV